MGSLALIARELGLKVRGCDANVYPPMSEQLAEQGVDVDSGYHPEHLDWNPDLVVVGNALSRAIRWLRRFSTAICPIPQGRLG